MTSFAAVLKMASANQRQNAVKGNVVTSGCPDSSMSKIYDFDMF